MATMFRGLGGMPGGGMEAAWFAIRTALNNILLGKLNCTGSVTLTANATSTTLTDTRIGGSSVILFTPTTDDARTSGAPKVSAKADGSATLGHTSDASTTRTYDYAVIG